MVAEVEAVEPYPLLYIFRDAWTPPKKWKHRWVKNISTEKEAIHCGYIKSKDQTRKGSSYALYIQNSL